MNGRQFFRSLLIFSIGILLISALFLLVNYQVYAAPAAPYEVTLSQPDGSEFKAITWGDEWQNGMETAEGYTILRDPRTDQWVYVQPTPNIRQAPQTGSRPNLVVGQDDPKGLPKHYRPETSISAFGAAPLPKPNREVGSSAIHIGEHPLLVLLVDFVNMPGRTTPAQWSEKIFGATESVGHFYYQASFNNLALIPANEANGTTNDGVVGWLRLPYNHPNPGGDFNRDNLQIVRDAIEAADPFVNFTAYDVNGDGYISYEELHIMVIVAGHESAYAGDATCSPSVWGHQYYLDYAYVSAPIVDGVRVASYEGGGGYSQFGEIHCSRENNPGHPATIGIIAHEFGHELLWPDLYDTSMIVDSAGIGNWGLMSTGMWNRKEFFSLEYGDSPAFPTAWSRWYQGWLTPVQITSSTLNVIIPPINTSGLVYQLRDNPNGVDWLFLEKSGVGEYFLLEYRQKEGYDAGLPGEGLLIWHIDESAIKNNFANADQDYRLVDLVQADGLGQLNIPDGNRGDAGDPFPGSTYKITFNASSIPNSNLRDDIPSGVSLKLISFDENGIKASIFVNSFLDVLPTDWYWAAVESLVSAGITDGCGDGNFCPVSATPRAQMAVLLLRAKYGSDYTPAPSTGLFADLEPDYWAINWIEDLYGEGLTAGCSEDPLQYCPESSVTRAEMAVFILRSKYGADYAPPPAEGLFADLDGFEWAQDWVEQLYKEGITSGCSLEPLQYCPGKPVTRSELAVFLSRAFNLLMP
jgi:M6 family metalloprotease-like protein